MLASLTLVTAALAGCSSGSSSSGGGSKPGSAATPAAPAATATFTGDLTGTMTVNLCTDAGDASIFVKVDGDSTQYLGTVTATQLSFIGPEAQAWAPDHTKDPTVPTKITSGSGGFSVDGVHAYYELPGQASKEIVVSGKILCP